MRLWLIRHAAVQLESGICYGASDVSADAELTRAAAESAARRLPPQLPMWVSGLKRAQQLAQTLQHLRADLQPLTVEPKLNEMNFGQWELQPWDAIPRSAFDAWLQDFAHHRFGGVESTQQVIERVADVLHEIRQTGVTEGVWVTHAGVIRAVRYLQANGRKPIPEASFWPTTATLPGKHTVVDI